jgi:[protein-PII] uridylyltransferase
VDGSSTLEQWKKDRVGERLGDVIERGLKARELIEGYSAQWDRRNKGGAYRQEPQVEFENQVSDRYTVIDVSAQDDVGLLYRITYALAEAELDIHMAIVDTVAARAADAFYVVDSRGGKIENYDVLDDVRERLLEALKT